MAEPWINFAFIREHADFATMLARYAIAHAQNQNQVLALCPFHDDRQPSLSVNLEGKLFHCFACQAKGDILDFVARIEAVSLIEAAGMVAQCCGIPTEGQLPAQHGPVKMPVKAVVGRRRRFRGPSVQNGSQDDCRRDGKAALWCRTDLDPTHRYLFDRGLTPELIELFGLGYCEQGRLRNRVCIPIHSPDGAHILAYSGRWASDDVPKGIPRYLMPRGFRKSEVLFNYHRIVGAEHLVIVEGYWSVFRLHALKVPAVALMGTSLSDVQIDLLRQSGARQLTLLLDADDAGRQATSDLLPRVASLFFVRTPMLPDGTSPDEVAEDLLLGAMRSRQ